MPGRGAAPNPERRATHRPGDKNQNITTLHVKAIKQPALPARRGDWPAITVKWWKDWGEHPLTANFTPAEWAELTVAAKLHATFWDEKTPITIQMKAVAELRQRMAKFGATPEDRLRLRIQFAFADQQDERADAANERAAARRKARNKASRQEEPLTEEEAS